MNNDILLQVEDLEKSFYLHEQGKRIPSSRDVNLRVRRGRLTALVGATGSGKSSVLKAVYRSYLPGGGRILYRGAEGEEIDLARAPEHRILGLRRNEIGFVTQFLHAPPRRATLDVVAQPLYAHGVPREEGRARAAELLARLNVPERLWGLAPATFSGGEKQRVNLARGVIARPRLLLLDEPTASLDRATTLRVIELFRELKEEGVGMLAVFHDPALVEALADERVELPPVAEFTIDEEVA